MNHSSQRKVENVFLAMHLTHFIYGYMASDIRLMTTQRERKPTTAAWATFWIAARVILCADTAAFVTQVVKHWLEREIAQGIDPTTHHTMSGRSTTELHFSPSKKCESTNSMLVMVHAHIIIIIMIIIIIIRRRRRRRRRRRTTTTKTHYNNNNNGDTAAADDNGN